MGLSPNPLPQTCANAVIVSAILKKTMLAVLEILFYINVVDFKQLLPKSPPPPKEYLYKPLNCIPLTSLSSLKLFAALLNSFRQLCRIFIKVTKHLAYYRQLSRSPHTSSLSLYEEWALAVVWLVSLEHSTCSMNKIQNKFQWGWVVSMVANATKKCQAPRTWRQDTEAIQTNDGQQQSWGTVWLSITQVREEIRWWKMSFTQ